MTRQVAPLGDQRDDHRRCGCLMGIDSTGCEIVCGEPAAVHIIYRWDDVPDDASSGEIDAAWDHGYACADHWPEYQARWACAAWHHLDAPCGMPGSRYTHHENRCVQRDLPVGEPARAVGEVVGA